MTRLALDSSADIAIIPLQDILGLDSQSRELERQAIKHKEEGEKLNNSRQELNLIEALKINCRKTVKEKTGKRPYTNVNLVRI